MSEQTNSDAAADSSQEGEQQTFDAAYVKKLREENAKYRTEAKANADAAKQLADIEEAAKTEQQKQADKLAAAERDANEAKSEALRYRVAAKFAVSDEDAELFLTGADEETLTRQAQRLSEHAKNKKTNSNYVPREGGTSKPADDPKRQFLADLNAG